MPQSLPARILPALLGAALLLLPRSALALQERVICGWTAGGAVSETADMLKDFQAAALGWGYKLTVKSDPEEGNVVGDFKAGRCDAVLISGVRAQEFNRASYTIEAMGALPTYDHLRIVVKQLAKPAAGDLLTGDTYETVGVYPGGRVYIFSRDRTWDTIEAFSGKRLSIIGFDKTAQHMAKKLGAVPVTADIGTFAPRFNNGDVDICYSTASAYQPFELHRGLGTKGGIVDYGFSQFTFQMVIKRDRFDDAFGDHARGFAAKHYDDVLARVKSFDGQVPASAWVRLDRSKLRSYEEFLRGVRVELRQAGLYDASVLKLMKMARCHLDSTSWECALGDE